MRIRELCRRLLDMNEGEEREQRELTVLARAVRGHAQCQMGCLICLSYVATVTKVERLEGDAAIGCIIGMLSSWGGAIGGNEMGQGCQANLVK